MLKKYLKCYSARLNSLTPRRNLNLQRRNSEPAALGDRCVVAVARTTSSVGRRWPISSQQLECDWLAPCRWVRFTQTRFFTFLLFCETHDLVWEIISVSEKRMKNCIVKIIDNVFKKNDEGGLFPLTLARIRCFATFGRTGGGGCDPPWRFQTKRRRA